MTNHSEPDYRRFRRKGAAIGTVLSAAVLATTVMTASAAGSYEDSAKIEGDYSEFTYGSYAVTVDDTVYQYATGKDGNAYYASYDGSSWASWQSWENQPAKFTYDPAPVAYDGNAWIYYTSDDGKMYQVWEDQYGEAVWEDVSGDYTYDSAPYAVVEDDDLDLYATGTDGNVYHRAYNEADGWSTWAAVSDDSKAKAGTEPYAVNWGGYENVLWTGDDGKVYWNRYDGSWSGAKALTGDSSYGYAPTAVGYAPSAAGYAAESSLYVYAVSADGAPAYNTFDGESWSGWEYYDVDWAAKGQPSAYVTEDGVQHVAYTADDGHAYYTAYENGAWSGEWQDLGENYAWDTYQYEYDGNLYLTYTGEDGSVYYRQYAASGDGSGGDETPTPEY